MSQLDPAQSARKIELIVAQLETLPTLPRVATQLLRLTRSDQASVRQVIDLIKQDQALTAKLLSLANRAGSGIRGEAATIDKCVLLMGLEAVRSAALSIQIFGIFAPVSALPGQFDLAGFWKHSLAVAIACEQLAACLNRSAGQPGRPVLAPDELFVAGLLHDIGKAALHHCLPKSYAKVVEAAEATHGPLPVLERRLIGLDHTVVGKRLAQKWGLPAGLLDAVWLHHGPLAALPESARQRGVAPVVLLADLTVRELRLGYSGNYFRVTDSTALATSLGVRAEDLEALRRTLPKELADRASLIGIDQLDSGQLYHDALTGANEELAKLNAKLIDRTGKLAGKARFFDLLTELTRSLQPGSRPAEVVRQLGQLFSSLTGAARLVVFSEPPATRDAPDSPLEGVVIDPADPQQPEQFLLTPRTGDIEGLTAARRAGGFEPSGSPGGFGLFPLEGHLSWVHHRLAHPLPLQGCCLLPLLAEGVWVGGVVFATQAGSDLAKLWAGHRGEVQALAAAAGQALRTAQLAAQADRLAEELAQSAEQCARLQEQLVRERTMASIGQMAAGAGHELNNPLMVISGRSELLAADEADPRRREALDQIRQSARRASGIISDLMHFARPPAAEPQPIDLVELVTKLASPMKRSGIRLTIQAEPDLPAAWADPPQLTEVIQEILDNAQQAMAAQDVNRQLAVRLFEPSPPARLTDRPELELVITDNGIGMDAFVLAHATDPFFSARPAGRGRGLGLARARRLIEHNGGAIRLESQPGAGTTVRITVPATDRQP